MRRAALAVAAMVASVASAWSAAEPPKQPPVIPIDPTWRERIQVLENGSVRIAADPTNGGRLIEYALDGRNVLYQEPDPAEVFVEKNSWIGPAGGRFDVGPDTLPEHPRLWFGPWTCERAGERALRMISADDPVTGVRLTREIALDADGSHVRCTQTIRNLTDAPIRRSHWSRTLAVGGGIFVTAITPDTRFPNGYVTYDMWPDRILFRPSDPTVSLAGELLVVRGQPKQNKLGFDTRSGWMAYLAPTGQLLVKRYRVYADRRYPDVAGLTMSFFSAEGRFVEVEPLGPEELIAPGAEASFSEDWWLFAYPFPAAGVPVDAESIRAFVLSRTAAPTP